MKWITKNKKTMLVIIIIIVIIAGLLDIRSEGLFFQLLPEQIQSYLTD